MRKKVLVRASLIFLTRAGKIKLLQSTPSGADLKLSEASSYDAAE